MSGPSASSYTVRRWSGLWRLALEVLPVAGLGVLVGALEGRWFAGVALGVVAVVLAVLAVDRATLAFRADSSGITWSRPVARVAISRAGVRRLDWDSVHDLEVLEGETVRARLRADAPLPGWMSGRVIVPGHEPEVVEGEAPGVVGDRVRDVARRWAPGLAVRRQPGRVAPPGSREPGR